MGAGAKIGLIVMIMMICSILRISILHRKGLHQNSYTISPLVFTRNYFGIRNNFG